MTVIVDIEGVRLPSPIEGVSDDTWTRYVRKLSKMNLSGVSASNALGMFEMTPRRLADLGIVSDLARAKSVNGKTIWTAVFNEPMTCDKFLKSPFAQYFAFKTSIVEYAKKLKNGEIKKPKEMSLSGALAILHRAGPSGIDNWVKGNRFSDTEQVYNRVAGIF